MAFMSASTFFNDQTQNNTRVLIRMETEIPEMFVKFYKKNVVKKTPMKTGALRRSIITQTLGNTAYISWRSPYARAQNEGGHTVPHAVRGINPNTGRGSTIAAGFYRYKHYTTPGTGPHFAGQETMAQTKADVERELEIRGFKK